MKKLELRKKYLQERMMLSNEEREVLSKKIIENFILQFNPIDNQIIHCFLPIEKFNEVNTFFLINYCWKRGIKVFVPKVKDNKLRSIEYHKNIILEKNSWGILEPKTDEEALEKCFDFIIVPLLYCDYNGNRVGYGKGFYDGLFTSVSPNYKKIGISFFSPKEPIDDLRIGDIPLDYLVTPASVLSFGVNILKSTK